ncbi:hypothetical protein RRG08_035198 [Elysia crispata]|uniref:Uncharacterized protein n=1 Tax=Elysia crispata TaxID=231223 RepID=A0AAE1E3C1_9GAST|nr:hypothetical protein RRG08_035198 [Elysia crispata]
MVSWLRIRFTDFGAFELVESRKTWKRGKNLSFVVFKDMIPVPCVWKVLTGLNIVHVQRGEAVPVVQLWIVLQVTGQNCARMEGGVSGMAMIIMEGIVDAVQDPSDNFARLVGQGVSYTHPLPTIRGVPYALPLN